MSYNFSNGVHGHASKINNAYAHAKDSNDAYAMFLSWKIRKFIKNKDSSFFFFLNLSIGTLLKKICVTNGEFLRENFFFGWKPETMIFHP